MTRKVECGTRETLAVSKCVCGTVARVVYPRLFPDRTKPQTGRLNKSPHSVHAFANRHKSHSGLSQEFPEEKIMVKDVFHSIAAAAQRLLVNWAALLISLSMYS